MRRAFANSADPDDPARGEPSRRDLHYLLVVFRFEHNTLGNEQTNEVVCNIGMEQPIGLLSVVRVKSTI